MKIQSNIPQLRFKEFEGEFNETKFGKLYSFHTTNSLSRDKLNYENGNIYNIHYGDIHTKFESHFYLRNENVPLIIEDVDLSKIKEESYCKNGDIIIADASEDYADIGKSIELIDIDNVKLLAGLHTFLARPTSNKTAIGFTSYLLKSWKLRKQIMTIAQGTKVLSLSTTRVSNLKLNIPTLPEQQKIASFLSTVDEKIQQLTRKATLLEQYKKGVMQQLFSGKLRFKDENGKDYPDWEEKKLGEVATKKSSNISANKIEENFGDFIIYGASGVLKKVDFYKEENDYISIVKDGAGVGRLLYCKGKSSVLGTMEIISPKQNIDTYFLYCLLSNIDFTKYITGSTIPHIYFKDYSIESCGIPSLKEQQKIANFLSGIDNKIAIVNQQLAQTQMFKKGLLQQMFV